MNVESMLGGLVGSFFKSAGSSKAKGKRMKSGGSSVLGKVGSGLKSPQGILAMVGLAFGAYEAYKSSSGAQTAPGSAPPPVPGMPPPPTSAAAATPPPVPGTPPPPSSAVSTPPPLPAAPAPGSEEASGTALKLIQAMIAAAHSDGVLDEKERASIFDRMKDSGLSEEETEFMHKELENPKSIEALTSGISDIATKKMMYGLSLAAIEVDTDAEVLHLKKLAEALELDKADVASLNQRFNNKEEE